MCYHDYKFLPVQVLKIDFCWQMGYLNFLENVCIIQNEVTNSYFARPSCIQIWVFWSDEKYTRLILVSVIFHFNFISNFTVEEMNIVEILPLIWLALSGTQAYH